MRQHILKVELGDHVAADRRAGVTLGAVMVRLDGIRWHHDPNPPVISTAADVVAALGAVAGAMANGDLTPDEAQAVAAVLESKRRAIETVELEGRIFVLARASARGRAWQYDPTNERS